MTGDAPEPLVPAEADLKDFPFTPIYRARLFGSSFHARATDAEWRAGVTLWLKSQDQTPAGSLPDDDIELCRLAELGRDQKTWRKLREGALHGWFKCSDGRLYNKVVAQVVVDQWQGKLDRRNKTLKARVAALQKRLSQATVETERADSFRQLQALSQTPVTDPATEDVTASKRKGQGKGESEEGSVPNGTGGRAPPEVDPVKELFDRGVRILGEKGRSLVGKARKEHGDLVVLEAISRCEDEHPTDPASFFIKALAYAERHENRNGGFTIGVG